MGGASPNTWPRNCRIRNNRVDIPVICHRTMHGRHLEGLAIPKTRVKAVRQVMLLFWNPWVNSHPTLMKGSDGEAVDEDASTPRMKNFLISLITKYLLVEVSKRLADDIDRRIGVYEVQKIGSKISLLLSTNISF